MKYLIEVITKLNERGIGFKSLTEQIDTTTSGGKLIFHVFGALAEFERDIIRERTQAGLAAARARGRMGGRPKKLDTPTKVAMAKNLYADHSHSIADICKIARHLARHALSLPRRPDTTRRAADRSVNTEDVQPRPAVTANTGRSWPHSHPGIRHRKMVHIRAASRRYS